jgi:hypothetical protein
VLPFVRFEWFHHVLIDVWRLSVNSQEAYQSTLMAVSGSSLRSFANLF